MRAGIRFSGLVIAGALCLPATGWADTQSTTKHVHRAAKKQQPDPPPPLPSGPQGPVPQVPLDAMPAVAPQVTYQDGMLTIVAPNSTLSEILKGVRKHTSADIEIPPTANERVVTRLGPAPAREVMAELLNGSKFNYILLGSPDDANQLVRVVLVAKTGPENPVPPAGAEQKAGAAQPVAENGDAADAQDDSSNDDSAEQPAEAEQTTPTDQPAVKTPQQMLQEMQQRQMQQGGQPGQPVQPGQPPFMPGRPGGLPPQQQPQQPQDQ
jgi:hypothetical protein